ncbi:DUF4007 family protein [Nguyenibacter vanlangensis]|uniref:DUF4007 family protein n=1 Tax=Nguyenibacter vanlangensis TaxID=1216886 RepID=A0ABZ3DA60_9PROT
MRNILSENVKAQFAGHETFPLRLLWPKKAYEAVRTGGDLRTFHEPSAIARFGVGRNMALSMRHWNVACGFIVEKDGLLWPTELATQILDDAGLDPFVEHTSTIWLAHWQIASTPEMTTTMHYAFNALPGVDFDADGLASELLSLTTERGWRATRSTIKRDVDVFLRSYVRRSGAASEDAAEPLLAELGLVREARIGGWFEFVRGPKPTLSDGVFAFALEQFWTRFSGGSSALTAEQITYEPGSPGRVFKLDEDSVVTRLMAMDAVTDEAWSWTDTAGLRQVQRRRAPDVLGLLRAAYGRPLEAA